MSWFSNQWNRWNSAQQSATPDVEYVEVIWNRQR